MIKYKAFYPLILCLSIFLAYFNCLNNSFIWDDEFLIQKNKFITSFEYIPDILTQSSTAGFGGQDNFYRPTQTLYYLLLHSIAGQSEVAFHLGNIFLHTANALLLFFLIISLFGNRNLAFATSLLWALHPTHTEAITYISGTADPMGFFFMILALLLFPYNKKNILLFVSSLFCFALALISKEALIIGPGLLVLCIYLKKEGSFHWKNYLSTLPFWFTSFIYLLMRKTILNFDGTYEFYKQSNIYTENILYRIYTYLAALTEYLNILLWPKDLHMERHFPVYINFFTNRVLLGMGLVLGSLVLLFILRKRRILHFSWLWFFVAFVPMMGILVPVNSFILEHWLYLSSVGFFLVVAYLITQGSQLFHKHIFLISLVILSTSLAIATHQRNKVWKTPLSFYGNVLQYNEGTARIHNNIAMAYSDKEDYDTALSHYLKAIEMSDTYPQTHYNLARIYVRKNDLQKALHHLDRSLEIRPNFIYSQKLKADIIQFTNRKPPQ